MRRRSGCPLRKANRCRSACRCWVRNWARVNRLEVRLDVSPAGTGASLVGGDTLRFVRGMQSATTSVSVTRESSLSTFSVSPLETTPSLVVDNASFTTSVSLNADVLERRVYSLAFELPALGVVANSSLGLRLSLVGADDLLPGEEISVSLGVSGGSGLSLSTSQVSFDSDSRSVEVRLDAEASASASTVSATVRGELPAGIDVSEAMAEVSVLPRELSLSLPVVSVAGCFRLEYVGGIDFAGRGVLDGDGVGQGVIGRPVGFRLRGLNLRRCRWVVRRRACPCP